MGTTTPQAGTRFDPSASDPWIVAVLRARNDLEAAFLRHDADAAMAFAARDVVVNAPINRVVELANITARFRNREIEYSTVETKLEFAGVRGELVVLMGEEIVTPSSNAPNAGKTVHRRFTDVWKEIDGAWKLIIRHATVTSAS